MAWGLVSMLTDMSCSKDQGKNLLATMIRIARDEYEKGMVDLLNRKFKALSDSIQLQTHLSLVELQGYAEDASSLEAEAMNIKLRGAPIFYAAASLKFYLVGMKRIGAMDAGDKICQQEAETQINKWRSDTKGHIAELRKDLKAYKHELEHSIKTSQSNMYNSCQACSYIFCSSYHGSSIKSQTKTRKPGDIIEAKTCCCSNTRDGTVNALKVKINSFLDGLEQTIWTREALEFEKCLDNPKLCDARPPFVMGTDKTIKCPTGYSQATQAQCLDGVHFLMKTNSKKDEWVKAPTLRSWDSSWDPSGCVVYFHDGKWASFFNSGGHSTGRQSKRFPVCKVQPKMTRGG